MSELPFVGYPGSVWGKCLAAVRYLNERIGEAATLSETTSIAGACLDTILAGIDSINAYRIATAWRQESVNLEAIQALPITFDPTTLTFLNNRAAAMTDAADALEALVPAVTTFIPVANALPEEASAIPDPGLLEFFETFELETAPVGLTYDTIAAQGQAVVEAFTTISEAISSYQGQRLTLIYDTATRMARVSAPPVQMLGDYTSGPLDSGIDPDLYWNQLITLPTFLHDANLMSSAPYSLLAQQSCVIRYALFALAQQIALFLLILRNPTATQVNLATINNGDTLMDVAARSMGDFEQWQNVANLNGLQPPWTAEASSDGVAGWGDKVLLPTPGSSVSPSGVKPSYAINFLGVDLYLGQINQPMLSWNGDFQVIAGLNNLAISLGRRLQTTLGTLLYHGDYGSKIPPEVGAVQTQDTIGHITAFGRAALRSDPRVGRVLRAESVLLPNFAIAFTGVVQPSGTGGPPVAVNEVLSPSA